MQYHDHDVQRALAAERVHELRRDARRTARGGRLALAVAAVSGGAASLVARVPRVELRRRLRFHA
jgi:hypothetical protein